MNMEGDGPQDQPAEPATLDGLAAMLGSDEPAADESVEGEETEGDPDVEAADAGDEQVEDEQEEPTFTIKVDGKDITLKRSEVLEQAQKGFDYTQKTMALAEERKAIEPLKRQAEQLAKQRQEVLSESLTRLQSLTTMLESQIGEPPSIELAQHNAAQYLALKEAHEGQKDKLHRAYNQIRDLQQQQHRERQADLLRKANETEQALIDTLPGWKDAPQQRLSETHDYLVQHGITAEQHADTFVERGLWEMAAKAQAYDRLMAAKSQLKPKAELQRVQKPTSTTNPPPQARRAEAVKRHNARPSLETLADLL